MAIHIYTIRDRKVLEDAVMTDALAIGSSSVSRQTPEQSLRAACRVWTVIKT
jgi:hypothetical protein